MYSDIKSFIFGKYIQTQYYYTFHIKLLNQIKLMMETNRQRGH